MWYDSPFRDPRNLTALRRAIRQEAVQPIRIMEVCGGQTYALSRYRIEELLPDTVRMIHGPGCPVCVTPAETVAQALAIARMPDTILCTFGDMMRVPDTEGISLQHLRTEGHDIRIVYSPLDALKIARENRHRQVVFLAVGFETTTPLYTLLLSETIADRRDNLSLLTSLFTLPAAIEQLARDPECRIDALLAAGHVCSITGLEEYRQLARQTGRPIVVTGFEPADLLYGIYRAVQLRARRETRVVNAYPRAVAPQGNVRARRETTRYFTPCDARWRGLGTIAGSGLKLRPAYEQYEARNRFHCAIQNSADTSPCRAGEIMKGQISPCECPLFGRGCTPDSPLGPSMVSSEGACAAFYRYRTA
ncbi:hydrogenase formation protein HypD [uncultured Barnesiella sp.]|uniref:hydrogenase formation protein HypD n=1 Tax=uncultured Barnesiella sp. TaxID=584861 RepID=UPI0026352B33|nr:hydrogenase formation protein HypD [uncultured Barnesiella sp.]